MIENIKSLKIRTITEEDIEMDTLDFKEYVDPFTGSRKK